MCADRCFSNPNKCETSSDYTRTTKQKTIFKDVVNQVQNQTNFIKSNGVNYNQNFGLHNNCLAFAKSYDLLLDVTKGKYYTKPVEDANWISNEAWSAGLYSVDYSANNVNVVVDTSYNAGNGNHIIFPMTQPAQLADISWNGLYPGVRVDPSYNIFYNKCDDQNFWRKKLVDMSFNNTNYYKQTKQKSEQLFEMYYPTNITFSCDEGCNTLTIINIEDIATLNGDQYNLNQNTTINTCEILTLDNNLALFDNKILINKGIIVINGISELSCDTDSTIINQGVINVNINVDPSDEGGILIYSIFINTGVINLSNIINHSIFNVQATGVVNNSGGTINNSNVPYLGIYNGGIIYNPQNQVGCANGLITGTGIITPNIPLTTCAP